MRPARGERADGLTGSRAAGQADRRTGGQAGGPDGGPDGGRVPGIPHAPWGIVGNVGSFQGGFSVATTYY